MHQFSFREALRVGWKTVPTSYHVIFKRCCIESIGYLAFTICKKFWHFVCCKFWQLKLPTAKSRRTQSSRSGMCLPWWIPEGVREGQFNWASWWSWVSSIFQIWH